MDRPTFDRTERLRRIVTRAKELPFYRDRLAGVDPADTSADDLAALPFLTRDDLAAAFRDDPGGGFLTPGSEIVQMHLTPSPGGRMPEYLTREDLAWQAEAAAACARRAGVREGDRCLVVLSYHMFAGGWLLHEGLQRLGATVLALGPADAATVVEIGERHGFEVLVSNPSFALKIGEAGGRFRLLLAAGEPFTAVPGYRERVEAALGARALDAYGLSETGIVAMEGPERDGLDVVEEACVAEVLEPGGDAPAAEGEKGELVLTSLTRAGMPILRFRTGDLTLKGERDGRLRLPRGVFGRTDEMVKVKGVKVYPKELPFLLASVPGLDFRRYQLVVSSSEGGTDRLELRVAGEPGTDPGDLPQRLRRALGVGVNEIRVEREVDGPTVRDERFGDAPGEGGSA